MRHRPGQETQGAGALHLIAWFLGVASAGSWLIASAVAKNAQAFSAVAAATATVMQYR